MDKGISEELIKAALDNIERLKKAAVEREKAAGKDGKSGGVRR